MQELYSLIIKLHIPAGFISLVLFWIPVITKKGGKTHRKVGIWYYRTMWVVVVTAALLSILNILLGNYITASFLGYLTILSGYPLWYSYEILNQKKGWTDRYFYIRKVFTWLLFIASLGMLSAAIYFKFQGPGILMAFFGLLGASAIKDALMTKETAMDKEGWLKMHIAGTIISGIAAYTAFFAFGGRTLFADLLPGVLQVLPWILPTILGIVFIRFQNRKYTLA